MIKVWDYLKEYSLLRDDILNAVDSISRIERKKVKTLEINNDSAGKEEVLTLNNQEESNKIEILVLDQMIE